MTFFAPSDFVSFWCADTQGLSLGPAGALLQHSNSTLGYNVTLSAVEGYIRNQSLESPSSGFGYHQPSWTIGRVLGDFVYNSERGQRHESASFNSDTPRNLRKECDYLSPLDNKRHKCTSYQYDTGIWMSTIIDEWNLVCDRSLFISITQSLYMSGFIVSYLVFGYLSDRFGRWNSLILGASIEIISGFGCAFSTSVSQFIMFRFLLGLGNAGRSSSSYLIMIEWTGQSWRIYISTLGSLGWVVGYCSMPWITMYFLHFRHMQLFVCFYQLACFVWLLCLPESPRWLLTHRRFDKAYQVLLRAAKFNGLIKPSDANSEHEHLRPCSSSSSCSSSGAESIGLTPVKSAANLLPMASELTSENSHTSSVPRKRLNSFSLQHVNNGNSTSTNNNNNNTVSTQPAHHHAMTILAPNHEVATHVEPSTGNKTEQDEIKQPGGPADLLCGAMMKDRLQPYSMDEFDRKFARLVETISLKEFTKNEDRLSIVDLFKWRNLRKYTFILAFAWCANSFVYYGIALGVGDFGGKNLFVSFSYAGITELPSIAFAIICMKYMPRRTANTYLYAPIFLLCALQVPLKYYELGWLQQSTMILAKLFNSCAFVCLLYQTMELFPTSIRQTAYSSCSLAGRIGSILAPFMKELTQRTNNLVPPVIYAVLSLVEIVLVRYLPETKGSDLSDTLLEAENFKGMDKMVSKNGKKKELPT